MSTSCSSSQKRTTSTYAPGVESTSYSSQPSHVGSATGTLECYWHSQRSQLAAAQEVLTALTAGAAAAATECVVHISRLHVQSAQLHQSRRICCWKPACLVGLGQHAAGRVAWVDDHKSPHHLALVLSLQGSEQEGLGRLRSPCGRDAWCGNLSVRAGICSPRWLCARREGAQQWREAGTAPGHPRCRWKWGLTTLQGLQSASRGM